MVEVFEIVGVVWWRSYFRCSVGSYIWDVNGRVVCGVVFWK